MQVASKEPDEGKMGWPTPQRCKERFFIAERGHRNKKRRCLFFFSLPVTRD